MLKRKVLIVAAHPDDEVIGCGGTASKLAGEGHLVFMLILGEGLTSRDDSRDRSLRSKELKALQTQTRRAAAILGCRNVFTRDFPDNRFDSVPMLDLVKAVEEVKARIRPEIILTHYSGDLNVDHRLTCEAVVTAARPMPGETVREIYSFEVLSSTEWKGPCTFAPDLYVDINESIDDKIKAMRVYRSEIRDFPHPRSLKGIRLNAHYRGMQSGLEYAEAFKVIRMIK